MMMVFTTPDELMDSGLWEMYCDVSGTNPYAVNEGLMDADEHITISEENAVKLGMIWVKER